MSRRLKRAAIISRLFFAAFRISLSRLLFLFEMLAIGDLSFETAWHRLVEAKELDCEPLEMIRLEEAVKREMNVERTVSAAYRWRKQCKVLTRSAGGLGSGEIIAVLPQPYSKQAECQLTSVGLFCCLLAEVAAVKAECVDRG